MRDADAAPHRKNDDKNPSSDRPLRGSCALVTASSQGLGAEIALTLAGAGADVAVHYRSNRADAEEVAAAVENTGCRAIVTSGDLVSTAACRHVVRTAEQLGRVTILVNNVGEFLYKQTAEHTAAEFDRIIDGTLGATFHTTKTVLPGMRQAGWGRIVNIGARGAEHAAGRRGMGPHLAGKSAVISLTRTLAIEEAQHGITVNAVNPGRIENRRMSREMARQQTDDRSPVGRPGTGQDVADAVLYFVSPASDWVTGAVLAVNGGQHLP